MKTKFGNAKIHKNGYYQISSKKEGNNGKTLHRLIWEDHYNRHIPKSCDIHHINGDKTDNRIQNLICVPRSIHRKFHNLHSSEETQNKRKSSLTGENNPMYQREFTKEHRTKMSEAHNTSGIYRVYKEKAKSCKKGFVWKYAYFENNKKKVLMSVDLNKLKDKVLAKGLEWVIIDEEKAKRSLAL